MTSSDFVNLSLGLLFLAGTLPVWQCFRKLRDERRSYHANQEDSQRLLRLNLIDRKWSIRWLRERTRESRNRRERGYE